MLSNQKIQLIIEKDGTQFWGRVTVNDNLLIDSATSLLGLEKNLKKVLKDFEDIKDVEFEYRYDLTVIPQTICFDVQGSSLPL